MKCEDVKELFSEYISGEMEPALAVSIENHLKDCEPCSVIVGDLRAVWASLDDLEVVEPPQFFHENLMSRIFAAADAEEEAAARRRAGWDWRSFFRPRTLAYAASIAVLLLAGMGGLHYSRASLDPIGSLLSMLRPAPVHVVELSASRAEWSPNAQGSGDLIVYLKAQPDHDGKSNSLKCVVNVPADLLPSGVKTSLVVGSEAESSITIPLKSAPSRSSLSVTLSAAGSGASATAKTEPITLMQPIDPPTQ